MKKKKDKVFFIICLLMGLLFLCVVFVGIWYYQVWSGQSMKNQEEKLKSYTYHCAFISGETDDPFDNSIYEGAKAAGEEKGILVEKYGESLSLDYEVDELLQMAIAAKVDAIILEGTGKSSTGKLIDQADQAGIVVVTVFRDDMNRKRRSFIGIQKFQMGYDLCAQALTYAEDDRGRIMVLFDEQLENPDNSILISGMQKYLNENSGDFRLDTQTIDSRESYNAEEQIRMLLREASKRPEVVVCTSLVQTQCVYQTLVDLNCVGDVQVIGFYYTLPILEAVEKGIIQATYVIDARDMGRQAVNSISEYKKVGYVSDFVSVNAEIVNQENAKDRIRSIKQEEEMP